MKRYTITIRAFDPKTKRVLYTETSKTRPMDEASFEEELRLRLLMMPNKHFCIEVK